MSENDSTPVINDHARRVSNALLPVPLLIGLALSFNAQRELAGALGVDAKITWMLPLAVEIYAVVSVLRWSGVHRKFPLMRRKLRNAAFRALGLSILLNGCWIFVHDHVVPVCWGLELGVALIPTYISGSITHMILGDHPEEPVKERDQATKRVPVKRRTTPAVRPTDSLADAGVDSPTSPTRDAEIINMPTDISRSYIPREEREGMVWAYLKRTGIPLSDVTHVELEKEYGATARTWGNVVNGMRKQRTG